MVAQRISYQICSSIFQILTAMGTKNEIGAFFYPGPPMDFLQAPPLILMLL
jgi:hypothetical protein